MHGWLRGSLASAARSYKKNRSAGGVGVTNGDHWGCGCQLNDVYSTLSVPKASVSLEADSLSQLLDGVA